MVSFCINAISDHQSKKHFFIILIWFLDLIFYITECSIKTAAQSITFQNVLWILGDPADLINLDKDFEINYFWRS